MRDHLDLDLTSPAVVVMMGASGAGKTTTTRRIRPVGWVVTLDTCRANVAGDPYDQDATPAAVDLMHKTVRQALDRGLVAVVDATMTDPAHRAVLVEIATEYQVPAVAVVVNTALATCLVRQQFRDGPLPGHRYGHKVPDDTVREQHAAVLASIPSLLDEGFAAVHVVREGRLTLEQVTLASRLRTARRAASFSQQDVAHQTGLSPKTVSDIEHGRRVVSALELAQLASIYGRALDSLVGDTDPARLDLGGLAAEERKVVFQFVTFLRHQAAAAAG